MCSSSEAAGGPEGGGDRSTARPPRDARGAEQELGGRLHQSVGWLCRGAFRSVEWLEPSSPSSASTSGSAEADEALVAGADVVILATGARPAVDRLGVELDGSIPVPDRRGRDP